MKALFFNIPAHGHVNPTLPLVRELVKSGDTIICYNSAEFQQKIENTGAEFRQYPEKKEYKNFQPENPFLLADLLWKAAEDMFPFILSEIDKENPQYIIHDSICPWGWAAAKSAKLPAVCSTTTFAFNRDVVKSVSASRWNILKNFWEGGTTLPGMLRRIRRLQRKYGFPQRRLIQNIVNESHLNLVYTSREFQPASHTFAESYHFIGPSVPESQSAGDFPVEKLDNKPLIYISLGTLRNNRMDFYLNCIEAFRSFTGTIVLSVGKQVDLAAFDSAPENFIIQSHVPQIEILKRAQLFITHGGMNSVNEGLFFGVPLLIFPQTDEQGMVAKRVQNLGAGLVLKEKDIDPETLMLKARTVLEQPSFRESAEVQMKYLRCSGGREKALIKIHEFKKKFIG